MSKIGKSPHVANTFESDCKYENWEFLLSASMACYPMPNGEDGVKCFLKKGFLTLPLQQ